MIYNNYPYTQMPLQSAQIPLQGVQARSNGLIWVQGEAAAKSFPSVPGVPVQLMDSEADRFYIKTTDMSGMPQPLRVFEYREITNEASEPAADYVTRAEFDKFVSELRKGESNGEQSV